MPPRLLNPFTHLHLISRSSSTDFRFRTTMTPGWWQLSMPVRGRIEWPWYLGFRTSDFSDLLDA